MNIDARSITVSFRSNVSQSEKSFDHYYLETIVPITLDNQLTDKSYACSQCLKPFAFIGKLPERFYSIIERRANLKEKKTTLTYVCFCLKWFIDLHFKNWKNTNKILIIFRLLAIIGLFVYGTIDTMMHSTNANDKSNVLKFVHGSLYIPGQILTIIYTSGAAAFGISIETYILIIQAIINAALVSRICSGFDEAMSGITWAIKLIIFFPAVELCHRNFRKLQNYNDHFNSSARSMLRQALLIGTTILANNLGGLKALYRAINENLPHFCKYDTSHCGIVDLYEPLFSYDDEMCLDDLSTYAVEREEIRLLRNFILLNIVSYSVFNKHFFKIDADAKYLYLRILLIILFVAVSTSIPISYIDSFFFIQNCRTVYYVIEGLIFLIIVCLMIFNLYQLRGQQENLSNEVGEMVTSPSLLP